MKSFRQFVKDEFLVFESIYYLDQHLYKFICEGKYEPTPNELKQYEMENKLLLEDTETDETDEDQNAKSYLDNEQELELIRTYKADPDSKEGMDALTKLIENKMNYIYSKVNSHIVTHPWKARHRDDLVQVASLALQKAIEDFDESKNKIFNALAKKYIFTALMNEYNPAREKSPTEGQTDENGNRIRTDSVDQTIAGARGEWADKDMTLGDILPDELGKLPGDDYEIIKDKVLKTLRMFINELPDREKMVMNLYFPENKEDEKTLEEIGKELGGMSKMGVKKMLDRIKEKLRQKMEESGLYQEFKEYYEARHKKKGLASN